MLAEYGLQGAEPYEPVGCSRCAGSGYRGRVGLYEVMTVSEPIRALILEHASVDEMVAVAAREGMQRLRDDGMQKVRDGLDLDRRGRTHDHQPALAVRRARRLEQQRDAQRP